MTLLLDTCALLWFVSADARMPDSVVRRVRRLETRVVVSPVSMWEATVKYQDGRLPLPERPDIYLPAMRRAHGFDPLPLDEAAVAHLVRLPRLHRDPFDRMLVCQAIEHDLTIVTPDPAIRAYAVKSLWGDNA